MNRLSDRCRRPARTLAGTAGVLFAILVGVVSCGPPGTASLTCVSTSSSGFTSCRDAGGVDSVCAFAKCPEGYTLTGGGGSCSAGDRKIKSLFPRFDKGEFAITCEQQGVAPSAQAICCKL